MRWAVEINDSFRESRPSPARYDTLSSEGPGAARPSPPPSTSPGPLPGNTHEDRVAAARERAQRRIAERMAAAGLKPHDAGESLTQRQEREKREREERLKRAEEEDAQREQERQRRIADEQKPATKPMGKKPPPAPPTRKHGGDGAAQADAKKAAEEAAKAKQAAQGQAIKEEQQVQEAERMRLE